MSTNTTELISMVESLPVDIKTKLIEKIRELFEAINYYAVKSGAELLGKKNKISIIHPLRLDCVYLRLIQPTRR